MPKSKEKYNVNCIYCQIVFYSERSFQSHNHNYHEVTVEYKNIKFTRKDPSTKIECNINECGSLFMTASGLKKHLKQNHGDLIKSSHGITSGFLLDLNHYLPQMELIDSISGPNDINQNIPDFNDKDRDSMLLFDPEEKSLLAFNAIVGVTVCTICEIGLEMTLVNDNDMIKFSCGVYHLRHFHKMDQDKASRELDWLVKYFLFTYIDPITIDQKFKEWKEKQSNYLMKSSSLPLAIEGIKIEEGIECLLCENDSSKAESFFTNTLFQNKNMRRHINECHQDQSIQVIKSFPKVSIQQIYQRNSSPYFGVDISSLANQTILCVENVFNDLFPIVDTCNLETAGIVTNEENQACAGIEKRLNIADFIESIDATLFEKLTKPLPYHSLIKTTFEYIMIEIQKKGLQLGIGARKAIDDFRLITESSQKVYITSWISFLYVSINAHLMLACDDESFLKNQSIISCPILGTLHESLQSISNECDDQIFKNALLIIDFIKIVLETKLLSSSNDDNNWILTAMKLVTYKKNVPSSVAPLLSFVNHLKYLLRGTVVLLLKRVERSTDVEFEEKRIQQENILSLVSKEPSLPFIFGSINAFTGLLQQIAPSIIQPRIQKLFTNQGMGQYIVNGREISIKDIQICAQSIAAKARILLDYLLMGYKQELLEKLQNHISIYPTEDMAGSTTIHFSVSDMVQKQSETSHCLCPSHCGIEEFNYFLHPESSIRKARVAEYAKKCGLLSDLLMTLCHITEGMLSRGTEIPFLYHKNLAKNPRSVIISHGFLCILSFYNKTNCYGKTNLIVRSLPKLVSNIMLPFLVLVKPFSSRLLQLKTGSPADNRLWVNSAGKPMEAAYIRHTFQKVCYENGMDISFSSYRHLAKAISREFIPKSFATLINIDIGFGHGSNTGEGYGMLANDHSYQNQAQNGKDGFEECIHACFYYQQIIGFDDDEPMAMNEIHSMQSLLSFKEKGKKVQQLLPRKQKVNQSSQALDSLTDAINLLSSKVDELSISNQNDNHCISSHRMDSHYIDNHEIDNHRIDSQNNTTSYRLSKSLSNNHDEIEKMSKLLFTGLKTFFKNPKATWRDKNQFLATRTVFERVHDVFILFPTGFGKTVTFLLSIFLEKTSVNLIILPTNSLVQDMASNLEKFGISFMVFEIGLSAPSASPQIILANYSTAKSTNLEEFLANVLQGSTLARIIFDECHCIHDWAHFIQYQRRLVEWKAKYPLAKLLFLSATLSEKGLVKIKTSFNLLDPIVYKVMTDRLNLVYTLKVIPNCQEWTMAFITQTLVPNLKKGELIQVFCRTVQRVMSLYEKLGDMIATYYHGEKNVEPDQRMSLTNFKRWTNQGDGNSCCILVATIGASLGIDYPHVRHVLILDQENKSHEDLTTLNQQAGRAGRDGEKSFVYIIVEASNQIEYWRINTCIRSQIWQNNQDDNDHQKSHCLGIPAAEYCSCCSEWINSALPENPWISVNTCTSEKNYDNLKLYLLAEKIKYRFSYCSNSLLCSFCLLVHERVTIECSLVDHLIEGEDTFINTFRNASNNFAYSVVSEVCYSCLLPRVLGGIFLHECDEEFGSRTNCRLTLGGFPFLIKKYLLTCDFRNHFPQHELSIEWLLECTGDPSLVTFGLDQEPRIVSIALFMLEYLQSLESTYQSNRALTY